MSEEKIVPRIICECGDIAYFYTTTAKKGKLWNVYRCLGECGADTYTDPKEPPAGDASLGTLFG